MTLVRDTYSFENSFTRHAVRILQFVAVILLLALISSTSLSQASSLSSQSVVTDASPVRRIRADFETVTKLDAHRLNMGIENWFAMSGSNTGMWVEGLDRRTSNLNCHSGSRCVGLEVVTGYRAQFNIMNLQNLGITSEYFVSVWLYLPADWRLHAPKGEWNWYELIDASGTPVGEPLTAVHIIQRDTTVDRFDLDFDWKDTLAHNWITDKEILNYPLPRGRWFNVQYYVFLDPTHGIVRVWIDDTLLWDGRNIPTMNPSESPVTTVGKIYFNQKDTFSSYKIWVDDLVIYKTQPIFPYRVFGAQSALSSGTTSRGMEPLPGTYAFEVSWSGASQTKSQKAASDGEVISQINHWQIW